MDECDRATQLIQGLLSKSTQPDVADGDKYSTYGSADSVTSHLAPGSNAQDHPNMARAFLQRRLSSVDACSAQAASTMKTLEDTLVDRSAALHALQVSGHGA